MARVESFDFSLYTQLGNHVTHRTQHARRVCHHVVCFRKIHRATVQRADFRTALRNGFHPFSRTRHI